MTLIYSILLISFSAVAMSSYDAAHVYADQLIQKFDKEIQASDFKLETSNTYKKILASREFIENLGIDPNVKNEKSILEVQDSNAYLRTTKIIDSISKKVIFPSSGRDGNVTGNQFPKNTWSLTFDDGPRGARTKKVVDNLYSRGIKATFFMLTSEAKRYPETAQYVLDAGMDVALHSYTHKSLANPSDARLKYEITQAKIDLEKILNIKLKIFRLPYGAGMRNSKTRDAITKNELVHIFWNVDTLDWKDKVPASVFKRAKILMDKSPKNSGIILFHDIHATTGQASELLMDYLLEKNLNICTVQDVIDYTNGSPVDCIK